jgi:eukaryotic-like serine/threonine-protein kinase
VQILVNVARRLADLHEAGWVHRDLKPGNVLWLPRKQRWTLIDFALAAHEGQDTPVVFTPSYAAPEIVRAAVTHQPLIRTRASMDAWALGVMAFELLSGDVVFDPTRMSIDQVRVIASRSCSAVAVAPHVIA